MNRDQPITPSMKEKLREYYLRQLERLDKPTSTLNRPAKTSPENLERIARSREIWKHNSFTGHARMVQRQMYSIMHSSTASAHAQDLAEKIAVLAIELEKDIRTVRLETY